MRRFLKAAAGAVRGAFLALAAGCSSATTRPAATPTPAAPATRDTPLSRGDSELVGRIILAEDRRDSSDPALTQGAAHRDPRIRLLAERARGRIADPVFAARTSLPAVPDPPAWPEPAWRLRYRALTPKSDCAGLSAALADTAWAVRLRATDLVGPSCAGDSAVAATLIGWVDALPADASRRSRGGVSWHAAAHAIVALARAYPDAARPRLDHLASHGQWEVRMYAARAAAVLSDSGTLRSLVGDPDDNVKEAAIQALAKLTGHADDSLFLRALDAQGAQAVRAAALALKGSPRSDATPRLLAIFQRWVARANASERDARVALLEGAGKSDSDDHPPALRVELPPEAIPLALGARRSLRVTMSPASGGGEFVVRLRGDVAPMMAARVLALARAGYYDGGTWHRVEADFVIQGGGPGTNEFAGSKDFFRDELGTIPHPRGSVGMSTRSHDTGDAQWFINLRDNPRLVKDYTVFGEVTEGIETVDGILEGDVVESMMEVPRRGP